MNDDEVDESIARLNKEQRRRGLLSLAAAAALAALTVGVWVSVHAANSAQDAASESRLSVIEQGFRVENLEKALEAQRQQFEACQGRSSNTKGCEKPVAPEPGDIGPQGVQGFQGLIGEPGATGPQGVQGFQGKSGTDGKDGTNGATGQPGESISGTNGTDGINGADGAPGTKGDTGPAGPQGEKGTAGQDGASAFPFSFMFTVPGQPNDTTYTVTCTEVEVSCEVVAS